MCAKLPQSCLTLCDPMDCNSPGSSVPQILQARILEWVAIPSSRGSSHPGIESRSPALKADSSPLRNQGSPYIRNTMWFLLIHIKMYASLCTEIRRNFVNMQKNNFLLWCSFWRKMLLIKTGISKWYPSECKHNFNSIKSLKDTFWRIKAN